MPTPILGAEFTVSGGTNQSLPTVTALANGKFAIGYAETATSYSIASFNSVGSGFTERVLTVTGTTTDIDNRLDLLGLADGTFVAVFADDLSDTDSDIYTTLMNNNGGSTFQAVNLSARFEDSGPGISASIVDQGAGRYAISFLDEDAPGEVQVALMAPGGAVQSSGPLTLPPAFGDFSQLDATVGGIAGTFAFANSTTNTVYADFEEIGSGDSPSITTLQDGTDATVYRNSTGIHLHVADGDAVLVQDASVVESGSVVRGSPFILALDDDRMLVVWSTSSISSGPLATKSTSVAGRIMNVDGSPDSGVFVIDSLSGPTADREDPDVLTGAPRAAELADGRVVVTWQDGFAGNVAIRAKYVDPRTGPVSIAGTDLDDQHVGTAFGDTFIEGRGNDKVLGEGGADRVFGGAGNDTLDGGAAGDVLDGGTGNDTLIGGDGNDIFEVNSLLDTVQEASGTAAGTADLVRFTGLAGKACVLTANVENLTLLGTNATNGTGNGLVNVIIGNAANNVLAGGGGRDTLNGGAGNDTYSLGTDTSDIIIDGAGADTISSTITRSLAGYGTIENLALAGAADINGTGNGLANSIAGNSGRNVLKGGAQNDTLRGNLGTDSLFGEAGNDSFVFITAADSAVGASRDVIFDLDKSSMGNDVIDLRSMAGVDTFIGTGPFTAAGQVRIQQAGGNVLVQINTAGTSGAESEILIAGATIGAGVGQVDSGDFLL